MGHKTDQTTDVQIRKIAHCDTWPIRHIAMWPHKTVAYVKLPNDAYGQHYGLFVTNTLVSVISLFIEGDRAQFRKFATLPQYQGQGYGSALLRFLLERAKKEKIQIIWCNSRIDKVPFYKKFGMLETHTFFSRAGIDFVILEKNLEKSNF